MEERAIVTTRAQLHDLIDRLPEYVFDGHPNPGTHPPQDIVRALRDLTEMTKLLWAVAGRIATGQGRLGESRQLS